MTKILSLRFSVQVYRPALCCMNTHCMCTDFQNIYFCQKYLVKYIDLLTAYSIDIVTLEPHIYIYICMYIVLFIILK